jgi:large subunit ribosomal protein L15
MTHEITEGLRHKRTQRKGRGESSGRGKTSGRGNKGSKARTGTTFKPGHEHGQTPIYRRLPKRGFSNFNFANDYYVVNLFDLAAFDANSTIDAAALKQAGLIPDLKLPVKVLGQGAEKFSKKLNVVAGWYSKSAHAKITGAGGTAKNSKGEDFQFPKEKKKFIPREKPKKKAAEETPAEAPAAETK